MQTSTEVRLQFKIEGESLWTKVDAALNWFRKNSSGRCRWVWLAGAIELMAAGASRFDISRFGSEVMRFSPGNRT